MWALYAFLIGIFLVVLAFTVLPLLRERRQPKHKP